MKSINLREREEGAMNWRPFISFLNTITGSFVIYQVYQISANFDPRYQKLFWWAAIFFGLIAFFFSFSSYQSKVKWYRWLTSWISSWCAFFTAMAAMFAIWYGCYWLVQRYAIAYIDYFRWGVYISTGIVLFLLVFNEPIVKISMGAKRLKKRDDNPPLWDAVISATPWHARPIPRIYIIPDRGMNAISFGWGLPFFSAVGATDGLVRGLDREELKAVLAHEVGHIVNKDILVSMAMTLTVMIMAFTGWLLLRIAPYGGGSSRKSSDSKGGGAAALVVVILAGAIMYALGRAVGVILQAFVSRQREYAADATASRIVGSSAPLKSALLKIVRNPRIASRNMAAAVGFLCTADPEPDDMMSTHPSLDNRILALERLEL